MHAEDLIVDDDTEGEEVEHVCEVVPDVGIAVFAGALGVEAVGLGDATGFVVSADEVDSGRVAKFKADKERDCFHAEEAAVDVVACDRKKKGGGNRTKVNLSENLYFHAR